jgi:short-subunit dehydrogenase
MKIAITGHTSGLGKNLYDELIKTHEVTGMSRANGYDLSVNIEKFVSEDFDIYINNAHLSYTQTDLLYRLFAKNKNRECTIINIGSVSSDGNKDAVNEYAVQKSALEKASLQLQLIDSDCKVLLLKLGRMNTPMTEHKKMFPRINTSYVVNTIKWLIEQPDEIVIKSMTIDILHSRRMET